jgi:hypothetical protein
MIAAVKDATFRAMTSLYLNAEVAGNACKKQPMRNPTNAHRKTDLTCAAGLVVKHLLNY